MATATVICKSCFECKTKTDEKKWLDKNLRYKSV
jgi:disulfide oxidoreductase YuzD